MYASVTQSHQQVDGLRAQHMVAAPLYETVIALLPNIPSVIEK